MEFVEFLEKLLDIKLEDYQIVAIKNFKEVESKKNTLPPPPPPSPPIRFLRP